MREILFRGKRTDNGEWIYGEEMFISVQIIKIFLFAFVWETDLLIMCQTENQFF